MQNFDFVDGDSDRETFVNAKLTDTISDLVFTEAESKNLRFRLYLMLQVLEYIRGEQLSATQAVKKLKIDPITLQRLTARKVTLLTVDQLLNMLEHCGYNVYEQLMAAMDIKK